MTTLGSPTYAPVASAPERLSGLTRPSGATLQRLVIRGRQLVPRGWSPLLSAMAACWPTLRTYPAQMADGTTLYLDLSQRMCHGLFFLRGRPFEYGTEKILYALLRAGDTFVDVGANVGYYSVLAGRIVGERGAVIAIEPQPAALPTLALNACHEGSRIRVVPVAASDYPGHAPLWVRPAGDTSSLGPGGRASPVEVCVDTIDRICASLSGVRLIKIDVEGFELEVLRGAVLTLARFRPWVCFELLNQTIQDGRVRVADIGSFFRDRGYVCHWVSQDDDPTLLTDTRADYVLATPAEHLDLLGRLPVEAFASI